MRNGCSGVVFKEGREALNVCLYEVEEDGILVGGIAELVALCLSCVSSRDLCRTVLRTSA